MTENIGGGTELHEAKVGPFDGLRDPLEITGKIAEQLAADRAVDWAEVLKAVGVMRDEDGRPVPGASELGVTAVSMIAGQKLSERNQQIADELKKQAPRFEDVATYVHEDVNKFSREVENLDQTKAQLQGIAGELNGIDMGLRMSAENLRDAIPQYRVDQITDAAHRIQSASRGY